ncbi:conserved hypothetical protein [Hyella patelloides LEGE 07179]|uniref:Uncharacterized protein n=1 Tax=Hyella patelloides LEGE 07179 TaxID=945734 RepID=A0A563W3D4_9CYAN|nr:hypothetical protein [Hyella patelloides]VEP18208.1 conserved hypothetical protein [Hyella patelloides LEGE 07179]
MKISGPQDREPTAQELQELEKLKAIIERTIADGKLTKAEFTRIKNVIRADNKVTFEEMRLVTTLIYEKIEIGELVWVWD